MHRIVPSRVIRFIDDTFPTTSVARNNSGRGNAGQLAALVRLVREIPDELLTMDSKSYAMLLSSIEHITETLKLWANNPNQGNLAYIPGFGDRGPVTVIYDALINCKDDTPAPGTAELKFIKAEDLREDVRIDIGYINIALRNGEWKAATVLAGSVIETLLLSALQQRPDTDIAAAKASSGPKLPNKALDEWYLPDYTEAAHRLKIIADETATQCRLAKDFRNLIHPGRAQRLKQGCDRGTALAAVAALEHVVRDLTLLYHQT